MNSNYLEGGKIMDSRNFTIGVLATTAVVLLVGILAFQTPQQPAYADGMTILKDDYSLAVGAATKNDEDLVYLIDGPGEKLAVYRFDGLRKEILLVQGIPLKEMRGGTAPVPAGKKTPPKKGP